MASPKEGAPTAPQLSLAKTLLKAFIIPLIVLGFYLAAPRWADSKIRAAFTKQIEETPKLSAAERSRRAERLSQIDFAAVANDPRAREEPLRKAIDSAGVGGQFRRLKLAQSLSYALLAILTAAILAILALNSRARRSRDDLIRSYRVGWRLASAAAIVQVLLLTPLLTYGLFEFTVLLADRYYPQVLLAVGLGGIFAIVASIKILLKRVPLTFDQPMSREVSPEDAPELWAAVRASADRLQTTPPDHIIVGMDLNFYVTELGVKHGLGTAEGKTLFLSYPLLRQLSEPEIVAIIGHELGHFIGDDTRLTREFAPMRRKVAETFTLLASNPLVGWTSLQFLSLFAWTFGKTEQEASRARELLADQKAAALTSPAIAARALVKFHAMTEAFSRGLSKAVETTDVGAASLETALSHQLPSEREFWSQLFEERLPHPLDSHPKLSVRLAALGIELTPEQAQTITQEQVPNAFGVWFQGRESIFQALLDKTNRVVKAMRERAQVETADYATDAGRELLDRRFPPRSWRRKPAKPWFLMIVLSLLAGGCGALMIFVFHEIVPWFFCGLGIAILLACARITWIRHCNGQLSLNATGISYTGWTRPLLFSAVKSMTVQTYNGETSLILHLKEKADSIWKAPMPIRTKAVSITVMRLGAPPMEIANTVFQYLTRQFKFDPAEINTDTN